MPASVEPNWDVIEAALCANNAPEGAMFQFDCGAVSHIGLQRTQNQDCYFSDARLGLWLVADGMGGHADGARASAMARECIVGEIIDGRDLAHAIAIANREIGTQGRLQSCTRSMGSTVVALHISGADFELAWVGDSRCYLAISGDLKQLSTDHTFMQELISAGILSPAQAKTNRYRNVVTQALGVTAAAELQIDSLRGTLRPGMQFLLCSDGLTEHVSDVEIGEILSTKSLTQGVVDTLINAALAGGGSDNVTAVVLRVETST